MKLVYFSSATNNIHCFVEKLGLDADRIPLRKNEGPLQVTQPYALVVPTYGGGNLGSAAPKQVIAFLNSPENRFHYVGVISSDSTNFGTAYCFAGDIVAAKLGAPHMYKFELLGTAEDASRVRKGLKEFWQKISPTQE